MKKKLLRVCLPLLGCCLVFISIKLYYYTSSHTGLIVNDLAARGGPQKLKLDLFPSWCHGVGQLKNETTTLNRSRVQLERRFPHAIIVGAKKCGTSSLLHMLRSHPMIDGPPHEMYFFSNEKRFNSLGYKWYLDQMPLTSPNQVTIEKSPQYFISDIALERLYNFSSTVKLIIVFRDPIVRSASDYAWRVSVNFRAGKNTSSYEHYVFDGSGKVLANESEVFVSMYDVYYKKWIEKFGPERIHVVNGDNLIRDPVPELRRIETFLQVPHYFSDEIFTFNATKRFYCWKRINREDQCTQPKPECMDKTNGREHPYISPESLEKVKKFISPNIKNFCNLNNRITTAHFEWCSHPLTR